MYAGLRGYFESLPKFDDWRQVESLEDLIPAIELYNTLIGLGRYDDAFDVYRDRIDEATHFRLSASRQRGELLEALFPDGLEQLPRLSCRSIKPSRSTSLALAYDFSGQPVASRRYFVFRIASQEKENYLSNLSAGLRNLSNALRLAGGLREATPPRPRVSHHTAQTDRFQEAVSLYWLGLGLAACGVA